MRKILISIFTVAFALSGNAATLSPVSLLNPAGSAAGQAIISTGPSTAPGWATIVASSVSPISADSVYANFSGSTTAPIGNAVPSCSTANSALKYTSGTGLSCGTTFALTSGNLSQFAATTSAQLAAVLSDETGTGSAVFSTSPSLTTPTLSGAVLSGTFTGTPTFSGATTFTSTITPSQTAGIVGTTTNNNANAGSVGEYVTATGTNVSIPTAGVPVNIASISLTAGDWDVTGGITFMPAGTTTVSVVQASVNTTSATMAGAGNVWTAQGNLTAGASQSNAVPMQRVSVASTTTVYLVGLSVFATSTMQATAIIRARRVR